MKKLLVVVDMQNDFVHGSLGSEAARAIVPSVVSKIEEYRDKGFPVIFTADKHNENYLKTQEGQRLPVEHCINNTVGAEILPELGIAAEDMVFVKDRFGSIELAEYIKNDDSITDVELVGLCTDICVVTNALLIKTYSPEVRVVADAACCAGISEETHNAALLTMKTCQVDILNWEGQF